MWFKNIHLYEFTEECDITDSALEAALEGMQFNPCGKLQAASMGWYPPLDAHEDAPLVHVANGFMMLCLKIEEKIMPAKVVNELLGEQIQEIETKEDRKVYRKEKLRLKDELIYTLLPRAFTQSQKIYAYIDPQEGLLIVDAASPNKAELFCSQLRKALGQLKVAVIDTQTPDAVMTAWLESHTVPQNFLLADSCVLQDAQDTSCVVRCRGQDLLSTHVQAFIDDGYMVTEVGLTWHNQLSIVLKDDFSLKRLQFFDSVKEQINEVLTETEAQRFDADFVLMTETLRAFFKDLLPVFKEQKEKNVALAD